MLLSEEEIEELEEQRTNFQTEKRNYLKIDQTNGETTTEFILDLKRDTVEDIKIYIW